MDWCWSWSSNTLSTWCKELTHWKRPWCWERLKREEKRTAEDEMVWWHHRLEWHEFEQAPGVGDGQGGLACCSPRGCKELDSTEWTDLNIIVKTTKLNFFYMCPLPKYLSSQSNTSVTLWRKPLPSPTSKYEICGCPMSHTDEVLAILWWVSLCACLQRSHNLPGRIK